MDHDGPLRPSHRERATDGGGAGTRLDAAKKVIKQIVSNTDLTSGANFGLMEWGTRHKIRVYIRDTGARTIYTNVDGVYASGGTDLFKAMQNAKDANGNPAPIVWEEWFPNKTNEDQKLKLGLFCIELLIQTTGLVNKQLLRKKKDKKKKNYLEAYPIEKIKKFGENTLNNVIQEINIYINV